MATCNFIKESKQTPSAMRAVIRYISQEKKTVDENGVRYLSRVNCVGILAFDEFMATKNLYRKKNGIFFYQYTQSFAPGEIESYAEAHEIGQELAKEFFPEYEVLVATHLDAVSDGERRIHHHFIVNSVSFENGKKLHCDNHTLERMRKTSNRICAEHGLSVLEPYVQTYEKKAIGTREYRSALKGESWKIRLIRDINTAMTRCGSRDLSANDLPKAINATTTDDSVQIAADLMVEQEKTARNVRSEMAKMTSDIRVELEQDGKTREQFMTDFCEEMKSQTERFDTLFSKMRRFMSITISATVTGAALLCTIVCLLMR